MRLLLFSLSITVGVAALVAIGSFRQSLSQSIDDQARTLVGADLIIESTHPFTTTEEEFLGSIGGAQAREVRLSTMAVFLGRGTRLVHLRALSGDFPFYGKMETEPAEAVQDLKQGGRAVADETLLLQFGAARGSKVSLGGRDFEIAGALKKVPGDASASASLAPRVYIALQDLPLDLLRPGSVAHYRAYVKFREGTDVAQKITALKPQIRRLGLELETVDKRKKDLGASLENLYRFLNLIGFISLLLGAVGIASAIQAHLQQKVRTGAILRCLGTSRSGIAFIYFIQASAISLAGALFGGLVGIGLQRIFPSILRTFLPLTIRNVIAWWPILAGVLIGCGICLLFAMPPLLRFRRVSPLLMLRSADARVETQSFSRDPLLFAAYALIAASITAFAIYRSETWLQGLIFAVALGVAVAIFAGVARLLIVSLRRWFPLSWS
ncbi:MAG: FtsX-like permease family protein, partial [Candidatus Udaeobacter sp.]